MQKSSEIKIKLNNNDVAVRLCGLQDENLKHIQEKLSAKIVFRGDEILISGNKEEVMLAKELFARLLELLHKGKNIGIIDINYILSLMEKKEKVENLECLSKPLLITSRGKSICPKTIGQYNYIQTIKKNDIIFGIGPAGTGKTYLAVIMAVKALKNQEVHRIILTRPAVEAGEKLGFLPGDLQDKIDPYLRPLYDGLYDVLGIEVAQRYIEKGIIEIAPLAYMRGRTLDDAFIILDEAQNTTPEQMKMFLTRLGFGSKAVVTGDITQVDLPRNDKSGLLIIQKILQDIPEIGFEYLSRADVVRHPVVSKIIAAYEDFQDKN